MSAAGGVAPAPASTATSARGGQRTLTGTGALVRFILRRDRVRLSAWVLGCVVFWIYCMKAVPAAYATADDLNAIRLLVSGPSGRMWMGPSYFLDNLSFQTFIPAGYGLYLSVLIALMSILLVVRYTRVEEQSGRADLVRANVVGRHAPLAAVVVIVVFTNFVVAVLVLASMLLDPLFGMEGSLLFVAGQFLTGLAFAGVTLIAVQVTEYSRTATSLAAGVGIGTAFVLRALGDMGAEHGTWLSWLSPLAWPQQTAPFVLDRWWPLLLSAGLAVLTTGIGAFLSTKRDVGAGLVAPRSGKARASGFLSSPLGLAWRLERHSIAWWAGSLFVIGLAYGAFAAQIVPGDMPEALLQVMGGEENIQAGYLAFTTLFNVVIVAIYAILAMQGLRTEETSGRGEPVLATGVSRWGWLGSNVVVGAIGTTLILLAAGLGLAFSAASAIGDWSLLPDLMLAHLNLLPAALVVLGLATLLFGVFPRGIGLTWFLVGWGFLAATFAHLLPNLPDWLLNLSPFEHPASMPVEKFEAAPVVWLSVITVATIVVGLIGFRARDIHST